MAVRLQIHIDFGFHNFTAQPSIIVCMSEQRKLYLLQNLQDEKGNNPKG